MRLNIGYLPIMNFNLIMFPWMFIFTHVYNDEIRIATDQLKLDDDGTTYIYSEPKLIKWTDVFPVVTVKQKECPD